MDRFRRKPEILNSQRISIEDARNKLGVEAVEEGLDLLEARRVERLNRMGVELPPGAVVVERRMDLGDKHGTLIILARPTENGRASAEDTTIVHFIPDE